MNPEQLSAAEAAADIRAGKLSPVELVTALLKQIDAVEARVQAWVTVDRENALAEARRCEAEARAQRWRGPLHGVPVGIKDIVYTKGLRTTAGSPIFRAFVPSQDARVVEKLRAAGAIVLGKTVTTEFATFDPGPTHNPWNLNHTPGGSSSGSAAAVASRMCPAGIGSQTVGSIGRPAAFCGVTALMPTAARVSRSGVFPVAWSLDHLGPFGRTVRDIELMLAAMSETPVQKPARAQALRIGIVKEYFYERVPAEVRDLQTALTERLASTGARVGEARLPAVFEMVTPSIMTIMRAEIANAHEGLYSENSEKYSPRLRALVETGHLVDSRAYLRAVRIRRKFQQEMLRLFRQFDVLLSPGAPGPAPAGIEATGDPVLNAPWTLADFPTLTLPFGLVTGGLPVAIQLSAAPFEEGRLLQIGEWCQEVINFKRAPRL